MSHASVRIAVLILALVAARAGAQATPPTASATPPTLEAITTHLDQLFRSSGTISRMEITMVTPRQTRTMRVRSWARGTDRALIVIEQPARDEGTATLRVDRSLWNYMPRISRTIRVPPSMMQSSWMGSDLTNDDLTQSTSYRRDFDGAVVGHSESPAGWLIRYEAHEGVVGLWRRIEFVVDETGTLPLVARHYDRRLELARVMHFEDVREMDGRRIPTRMVLEPQDQEGHRTEMRYLSVDFDADVPESTFSLTELEQRR